MKQETQVKLRNYAICVGIEIVIAFLVIWSRGFFTDRAAVNLQIFADAFFVAGILMTLFAGMMYVSSEGALIGISFVLYSHGSGKAGTVCRLPCAQAEGFQKA